MIRLKKVSVIVAAYNIDKYISDCLNSILIQTYPNIEVLVIDDGSKDSTAKIAKEYCKKDSRFKYFYKENGGISDVRNFGINKSSGDYIMFVDGDDILDKHSIEVLMLNLLKTDADLSICNHEKFITKFNNVKLKKEKIKLYSNKKYIADILSFKKNTFVWGTIFKRRIIQDIVFPKNVYFEDLAVYSDILLKSNNIVYSSLKLVKYRQNADSIVHNYNEKKLNDFLKNSLLFTEKVRQSFPDLSDRCDLFLSNAYLFSMEFSNNWKDDLKLKVRTLIKFKLLFGIKFSKFLKFTLIKFLPNIGFKWLERRG